VNIVQCIDGLQGGGKERRLVELIKGLRGFDDIRVSLVLFSDRLHYQEVRDLGIEIHILRRKFRRDPRILFRFASLCAAIRPDVVHAWGSFASVCAIPAAKWVGAKFVTSMITHAPTRSALSVSRRMRAALVFPVADIIVANSEAGLLSYRAPLGKSLCIHNGFDFNRLAKIPPAASVRSQLGIRTRWAVGMVASFSPNKDYLTYIAGAVELLEKGIDATFIAIGDGPMLTPTRAKVPPRWRERILFTGAIAEVEALVNALDVGVLCTDERLHGEGIPNAVLEYMAAGKPAIATAGGGTGELLHDNVTGFLVAPRDAALLAQRMETLLKDEKLRLVMGEKGRERVSACFSIDAMIRKHLDVYRELSRRA
jgi:glycosyltransferase involved in cell wall biosynthesis